MSSYETIATVEDHGQVHLAGLPFAPGTEVEVAIKPAHPGELEVSGPSDRAARLFAALDKARNASPIGALGREELMTAKFFVDTSILIYAGSNERHAQQEPTKSV